MTEDGDDAPPPSHGLVKEGELTQHRSAVIVDALARQPVIGVKRIDRAKRELHPPPSRWPGALWKKYERVNRIWVCRT